MDSIDSRTCPTPDTHRRSKSILKKSDPGSRNGRSGGGGLGAGCDDPETEKLISSDNSASGATGAGSGGGCDSDYSPSKLPLSPPATPAASHRLSSGLRGIGPKSGTKPHALPIKFVGLDGGRGLKSPLVLLEDLLGGGGGGGEKHSRDEIAVENKLKERLEMSGGCGGGSAGPGEGGCCGDTPLYICPPPPLDDHSPTEETKLLVAAVGAVHHQGVGIGKS